VERDYVQALFWLDLAAAQGNAEARDIRGQIAARMTPATRDIAKVDCKTVMRLDDRERESAIVFLHGYLAGKKGDTVIDLAKLGAATDKFIDNCLDNPKSKALDVMTAAVQ
jgi:TPR repeat protein